MPLPSIRLKNPLVTVYILNYNYGDYIEQAIESCLGQTFSNFELIILDDGSTDDSKEDIRSFEGHNNITVIYQSNKGLTTSANIALKLSKGKYIMRLDADDWLEKNALEQMVGEMEKHNDAVYLFPDFWLSDINGNDIKSVSAVEKFKENDPASSAPHGACTIINVQKMREAGLYNESIKKGDGLDLYNKLHMKGLVIHLPFFAFHYRQHGRNWSRSEY